MNRMDTLLTVRQLQDLLQVDRITIYRMLSDGRLQGFKVGGQWRFSRQAIEDWLQQQQGCLEAARPSGTTMADIPLRPSPEALRPSPEALPLSCIQAVQDIFAQALGIAVITTAPDGTPLTSIANPCPFCTLIFGTRGGRQRCINSWRKAAEEEPGASQVPGEGSPFATCHAGLCYAWSRIEVEGQLVAVVHAGQFLDRAPHQGDLAELAAATGLETQELQAALALVPVLDRDRQERVVLLLPRVAATFAEIGTERLNLLGRLRRIAEISGYQPVERGK